MLEIMECPACGETYSPPTQFCERDGTQLEVAQTLVGRVLDGRYRIDELIGKGGMGTVYCATHIQLDDKIAVKVLNPELVNNKNAIERFRQEALAARRIKHQNAAQVTDFGVTADNLVYLVMEFVVGRTLRELMQEGVIEYRRAAKLLSQICAGIGAAHEKNIIHRDLKPENIMVQEEKDGREIVKVLDFGIAKLLADDAEGKQRAQLTLAGMIIGTPEYMSPEQCQSRGVGPASDIYAIGVIAYEMLSGATPFTGKSAADLFVKHLHARPTPLGLVAPQVPEILAHEIMQALEKEPAERHPSATEFARRLRTAIRKTDGGLTTDPPPSSPGDTPDGDQETQDWPEPVGPPEKSSGAPVVIVPETKIIEAPRPPDRKPSQGIPPTDDLNKKRKRLRVPLISAVAVGLLALAVTGWAIYKYWPGTKEPGPPPPDGMVLIKGGKFMMGRNDGETDERPAHEKNIKDFYLDKYEVTNREYKKFVDATGHTPPQNWTRGAYEPEKALLPVTYVTWKDAAAYAQWANKRLPFEEEWEYAARGGSKGFLYPWGSQWSNGNANANNPNAGPLPVGTFDKDKSPFGIFDLAGNVSEWVDAFYRPTYDDKLAALGCGNRPCRVHRGGRFVDTPDNCTTTHRRADFEDVPQVEKEKKIYLESVIPYVGFRCAKDVPGR